VRLEPPFQGPLQGLVVQRVQAQQAAAWRLREPVQP